jgi:hypothetical protein
MHTIIEHAAQREPYVARRIVCRSRRCRRTRSRSARSQVGRSRWMWRRRSSSLIDQSIDSVDRSATSQHSENNNNKPLRCAALRCAALSTCALGGVRLELAARHNEPAHAAARASCRHATHATPSFISQVEMASGLAGWLAAHMCTRRCLARCLRPDLRCRRRCRRRASACRCRSGKCKLQHNEE